MIIHGLNGNAATRIAQWSVPANRSFVSAKLKRCWAFVLAASLARTMTTPLRALLPGSAVRALHFHLPVLSTSPCRLSRRRAPDHPRSLQPARDVQRRFALASFSRLCAAFTPGFRAEFDLDSPFSCLHCRQRDPRLRRHRVGAHGRRVGQDRRQRPPRRQPPLAHPPAR